MGTNSEGEAFDLQKFFKDKLDGALERLQT